MPGDLFGFEAPIEWDERGVEGVTRDGRKILIEASVLTARWVAIIPVGKDVFTRRARITIDDARRDAERAVRETSP